jgi:hypothetical protein
MNESRDIKQLVRLIADGLLRREAGAAVVAKLVAAGVPANDAPAMYAAVKTACQQGVQAVITGGLSAPEGPPTDPLLAEAFRVGQATMRGGVRAVWMKRVAMLMLLLAGVGVLIWVVGR